MQLRKLYSFVEETLIEKDREVKPPTRKSVAVAIVFNPCAGDYHENLESLFEIGHELGSLLGVQAVKSLGIEPSKVHSYGKGAIVGMNGEIEHAAAVLHPRLGASLRSVVGGGKAIIPSAKKVGGPGTSIDVPLFYKEAAFVVSHIDSIEVRIPNAPNLDEILVAIALTDSGRPLARSGGLKLEEIVGEDGLS